MKHFEHRCRISLSVAEYIENECKKILSPLLYNYMQMFEGYIEHGREFNRLLDLL